MITIGNFFFRYRNLLFPVFALTIFIPSPPLFSETVFGNDYYLIPLIAGLTIAILGQIVRAATIGLKYIVRGGKNKKVYAKELVTDGIFNHCRNPLYVGNMLMLSGVGMLSNSLYFVVFVTPVFLFIYQAIVVAEENFLKNKFGEPYNVYCEQVNRWAPQLKGLINTFESMQFNWRQYIVMEYNTIYLLILSVYLVLLTHHPEMVWWDVNDKIRVSFIVISIATVLYLFVRYLKKSKRLNADYHNRKL